MIDKARMRANGTLGAYLIGHSPVDRALMKRLGIGTDAFVQIATEQPDDAGVLAALQKRGFDEVRVRRWSDRFDTTYAVFIRMWDIDEGYSQPTWLERPYLAVFQAMQGPLMTFFRIVSPAP